MLQVAEILPHGRQGPDAILQWLRRPGPWFNIKMTSYQYRKSHCGDKTVVRSSYLHNGTFNTGKMSSLYWTSLQTSHSIRVIYWVFTVHFEENCPCWVFKMCGHLLTPYEQADDSVKRCGLTSRGEYNLIKVLSPQCFFLKLVRQNSYTESGPWICCEPLGSGFNNNT